LPREEREGNFGHFFYTNEKRMPPCGPPISKPEMGGRGDAGGRMRQVQGGEDIGD